MGFEKEILLTASNFAGQYYKPFDTLKRTEPDGSKKWRHIDNPVGILKLAQHKANVKCFKPIARQLPEYLTGGLPGRSILKNINPHLGKPVVITMDIEGCYPSINNKMVYASLRRNGFGRDTASTLTKICTLEGRLPQGSPASPILGNLVLEPIAKEIYDFAHAQGLDFTIYVDDVTLSGSENNLVGAVDFVSATFSRHGLRMSRDKTTIMNASVPQKITGSIANKIPGVPRIRREKVRKNILSLAKSGYASKYDLDRIWGQINNVAYLNPTHGAHLNKLAMDKLSNLTPAADSKEGKETRPCSSYSGPHKSSKL